MSGPSSEQLQLQNEQIQFYQQGMKESETAFAEDQALLAQMKAVYQPIFNRGPNQTGFSAPEEAALNAQATEGTAETYSQAARAVNEAEATQGGGNPLPSGEGEQLREEVALSAARQESGEKQQILEANYAEGEKQFEEAAAGLSGEASLLNPTAYETAATGAGSAAEQTASAITSEENSWLAPVLGAAGALGGATIGAAGKAGGFSNLFS